MRRFAAFFAVVFLLAPAVQADYTAMVDPRTVLVDDYAGWGTCLCWWANVVGGYANREDYANLAFSRLKLNIVRYNIGGGENPGLTNTITNYRAIMPGFEPTNGVWNWQADMNQRWMLRRAVALGADRVMAFANSPPWWMTVSGSVTGAVGGTNDNLRADREDAFAVYLTTVIGKLTALDDVHFDYLTPLNEPTGAWTYSDGKQEGCHIDHGQQARLVDLLRARLDAAGLDTRIDAPGDFSEQDTLADLADYSNTLQNVALVTTHTYQADSPRELHYAADLAAKPLWVTEYGDGDATGLQMARRIHDDITGLQAQAWVYWQVVEPDRGWGLLYNPLQPNADGRFDTNYVINEKFYVLGQFSEFIRPGSEIIRAGDTNTLAAYDPAKQTLTLVMVNTNDDSFKVTYDLSGFRTVQSAVAVWQTDPDENLFHLPSIPVTDHRLTALIPGQSVTTLVLTNTVFLKNNE